VRYVWLFCLVLAVPLIGYVSAEGIKAHLNSEVRSALTKKFPTADPAAIGKVTLDSLCKKFPVELREICGTNSNLNLLRLTAAGTGVLGLFLLLVIWIAGSVSRNSRHLLLWLFRPGLYITGIIIIILVVMHAGIAMATIYYVESALIKRIHVFIIGMIGLGALVGVIAIVSNILPMIHVAKAFVIGKSLSQNEAPDLWHRVKAIAERLHSLYPDNVVVGLDPNFFVTEANVVCLSGNYAGLTLYCSLPLMRILNITEFQAIVGHELSHYKGLDTKFSKKFFPIYRGTSNAIYALLNTGGEEGAYRIALFPAIAVFSYFLECFSIAESNISRNRELEADKGGVTVSDGRSFASALVKVHAFSGFWEGFRQIAAKTLQEGKVFINASKTYSDAITAHANPEVFEGLADTRLSHPTDSHPPLNIRLEMLGISLSDIETDALKINPVSAAISLVKQPEQLEEEISFMYQGILAKQMGIVLENSSNSSS
jgi:Zn-dependent protease with chaperone function